MQTFQDAVVEKANNRLNLYEYIIKGDIPNCTIILDGNSKIYSLKATSETETRDWLSALSLARDQGTKKLGKVFGIPLNNLTLDNDGVPQVISQMVEFLSTRVDSAEEFLKGASNAQRLLELRDLIDKGILDIMKNPSFHLQKKNKQEKRLNFTVMMFLQ